MGELSVWEAAVLAAPVVVVAYAYLGYPLLLRLIAGPRLHIPALADTDLPSLTVVVISYNEEANLRKTIENLLQMDYPREKVQYLMVSDGSTDGTDDIIQEYADQGVEYLRVETRGGKTLAENEALPLIRGDVVLNSDAAVRVDRGAARALVAHLADPTVGAVSGRDISVASDRRDANWGESIYVRYEMMIRELETRSGGIIGASGCLFVQRRELQDTPCPAHSFRDFATPLVIHTRGFRTMSSADAICFVPRTPALHDEYRRKVRTTARGLSTLLDHRSLWNPLNPSAIGWKIISHKVCRWLAPITMIPALAVLLLGAGHEVRVVTALLLVILAACLVLQELWPTRVPRSRLLDFVAAAVAAHVAVAHAGLRVLAGDRNPVWEPTRRNTWSHAEKS